ncbi:MAG: PSD1 and planctomycete cytochrome C domain-containing protein [Bryobacterales bacterium]|nr:PSD1 and planctomycete cytochrome C domain-containing protein [Bryobacterales bacterium]
MRFNGLSGEPLRPRRASLRRGLGSGLRCTALLTALCAGQIDGAAGTTPTFDGEVGRIFKENCIACHGDTSPQAGLDLRSKETIVKGGKSGPAVVAGSSASSLLLEKVVSGVMPPGDARLPQEHIDTLRVWIDKGAPRNDAELTQVSGPGDEELTEHEILPIFQIRCVACHGKRRQEGGLDLRTVAGRIKGGKSGPALIRGDPDGSLLIQRIESGEMPPPELQLKNSVRPLTENELQKVRRWIAAGAPEGPPRETLAVDLENDPLVSDEDRRFWSFLPPKRPEVPAVESSESVKNPIDAFLLRKLSAKGLTYSQEAERAQLMRRAYLDLIGMPPTQEEVKEYLADLRPDAYERLVDRLLDSSRYGERWARHWLDLAGHSDSEGFGNHDTPRTFAWRYRDYVVRSLNSDKPYDRFLMEQIAGDELGDYRDQKVTQELIDRLAATGFLRTASDPTDAPERGFIPERMNIIADEIQVMTSAVMGITVGCARCHDHKYDPIPQRDYYRFSAILQTAYDPYDWLPPKKRQLDLALDSEKRAVKEHNTPLQEKIEQLEKALAREEGPYRKKLLEKRLAELPEGVREDLRTLDDTPKDQRTSVQQYLAGKFAKTLEITSAQLKKKYPEIAGRVDPIQKELAAKQRQLLPEPHIRVLMDTGGESSVSYLLQRGDPVTPVQAVEPGVPSVLKVGLRPYEIKTPYEGAESSGRRLALARWLTQPNHPLTSRVLVNQLWMRHFGRGIVASPANFGRSGLPPSHPELLDWLATEFVASGWSIKHMHRLMMTSTAYRQTSQTSEALEAADPENGLLSRMPLRRMDAETLYDSILRVTGRLDEEMFGPPSKLEIKENKEVVAEGSTNGFRRSLYVTQKMQKPLTLLDAYDLPRMTPNCIERRQSQVPTQALQMMNGTDVWEHSRYMAGRLMDEVGTDPAEQVEAVFVRTLSRRPSADEKHDSLAALNEFSGMWLKRLTKDQDPAPMGWKSRWLALASYCHTMLNSAEFSFID